MTTARNQSGPSTQMWGRNIQQQINALRSRSENIGSQLERSAATLNSTLLSQRNLVSSDQNIAYGYVNSDLVGWDTTYSSNWNTPTNMLNLGTPSVPQDVWIGNHSFPYSGTGTSALCIGEMYLVLGAYTQPTSTGLSTILLDYKLLINNTDIYSGLHRTEPRATGYYIWSQGISVQDNRIFTTAIFSIPFSIIVPMSGDVSVSEYVSLKDSDGHTGSMVDPLYLAETHMSLMWFAV